MSYDLTEYRNSPRERNRINSLLGLLPKRGLRALDVGAREGYLSRLIAERCNEVIAFDLVKPAISHPGVTAMQGDVTQMEFGDDYFDVVLCAEVLEHIPRPSLMAACAELTRVCSGSLVVGVPYRQDLRIGRTTCGICKRVNPPWGHVNSFDEMALDSLFPLLSRVETDFVGETRSTTTGLSAALRDFSGNPYGTYGQEERCIHCGAELAAPAARTVLQRAATRAAALIDELATPFTRPHANWLHARYAKQQVV